MEKLPNKGWNITSKDLPAWIIDVESELKEAIQNSDPDINH